MTDVGEISVAITADTKALDAALARVSASKVAPVNVPITADTKQSAAALQAAERGALSFAQARSRLLAQGGDLAGAERVLSGALNATTSSTAKTVAAQTQLLRIQQQIAKTSQGAAAGSRGLGAALSQIGASAGKVDQLVGAVAGLGGAFAAVGAATAAVDFARQGASIEAARQSFDNLAASAGTSGAALMKALEGAAAGTVAQTDIIKSSNTALLLLGSDVATKLPQLLAVAKASATTLGTDVGQVFDSLVTGISRGSTELIDNAGITVKAAEAYATYAASIGTSADALSSSQKQQAILNAVLTAGEDIIAKTSSGGASAAQSYQQMDAALANLTATAQVAAAGAFEPLAAGIANTANAVNAGISSLVTYGDQLDALNQRVIGAGGGYADYLSRIESVNTQIRESYGIFGAFAQVVAPLSEGAYALQQSLVASGVGAEEAAAKAAAYQEALYAIGEAQNIASQSFAGVAEGYTAVAGAATAAIQADADVSAGVAQVVAAFNDRAISAQEAQTQIAALVAAEQEQAVAAAASADAQAALLGITEGTASAALAAAEAANKDAFAKLEQGAAADEAAQRHAELREAVLAAASGSATAEGAAAAIAAQFNGVEAPAVAKLINLYRDLAAAKAGAANAKAVQAATTDQRAGERNLKLTGDLAAGRASQVERLQAQALKFEQDLARRSAKSAGGSGGSGGSGAKKPKMTEAEKQAAAIAKVEERYREAALNAEETYQERRLKITEEYAQKRAKAEQSFANAQSSTKNSFYQSLASVDQKDRTALITQFEAEKDKAAQIASTQGADAGEAYLSEITGILKDRLERQKGIAEALKSGDKAEAKFLQDLDAMARAEEQRRLDQAAAGGQNLGAQEQAALADADAQRQDALAEAGDKAGKALAEAQGITNTAALATNSTLTAQLALLQQISQAGATPVAAAPTTGGATPAALPAVAPAATQTGGPVAVSDAATQATLGQAVEALKSVARALDKLGRPAAMGSA